MSLDAYQGTETMPKLSMARRGASTPPSPQKSPTTASAYPYSTIVSFEDMRSSSSSLRKMSSPASSPRGDWEFAIHEREQRHALLSQVSEICHILGAEGTRLRMVPVMELLAGSYDDCGPSIAQMLPELLTACGGLGHVSALQSLLSICCVQSETTTTIELAAAIRAILVIARSAEDVEGGGGSGGDEIGMSRSSALSFLKDMIMEMCASPWSAPRSVGAALVADVYFTCNASDAASKRREETLLRVLFTNFCRSAEDVVVRRAAVSSLSGWLQGAIRMFCNKKKKKPVKAMLAKKETASSDSHLESREPFLSSPSVLPSQPLLATETKTRFGDDAVDDDDVGLDGFLEHFLRPILTAVAADDNHDSLRVALLHQLLAISTTPVLVNDIVKTDFVVCGEEHLISGAPLNVTSLLGVDVLLRQLCNDKSWRVRYTAAKHLGDVFQCLVRQKSARGEELEEPQTKTNRARKAAGPDHHGRLGGFTEECSCVERILNDEETEVRAAAVAQLVAVCAHFPPDVVDSVFVPMVEKRAMDESPRVRAAVAPAAAALCSVRSHSAQVVERMTRLLLKLMEDPSEATQAAAIQCVALLPTQAWVAPPPTLPSEGQRTGSLSESIFAVSSSPRWRIREAVALVLPDICKAVAAPAVVMNGDVFRSVLAKLLSDPVASVRGAIVNSLGNIGRCYGARWSWSTLLQILRVSSLLPTARASSGTSLQQQQQRPSIWMRINGLHAIVALLPVVSSLEDLPSSTAERKDEEEELTEEVLTSVITALSVDPVSNVRLIVAKGLRALGAVRCRVAASCRAEALERLEADHDTDVRQAAQKRRDEPF
jgi:hypothetical protein